MTRMLWLLAGLMLVTNLGCQTLPEFSSIWEEKAPQGLPNEIAVVWQEGVDVQFDANQGGNPAPGFAGRVYFMRPAGQFKETIAVNGSLLISLYDDQPYQGPPKPLETWTIKPEHMPMLFKKDLGGWGYSVWLPWHTANPAFRNVRMIVEYTGCDGSKLPPSRPEVINIQANRGGLSKPSLKVETLPAKKTWQ